jgi:hypothetical protein
MSAISWALSGTKSMPVLRIVRVFASTMVAVPDQLLPTSMTSRNPSAPVAACWEDAVRPTTASRAAAVSEAVREIMGSPLLGG